MLLTQGIAWHRERARVKCIRIIDKSYMFIRRAIIFFVHLRFVFLCFFLHVQQLGSKLNACCFLVFACCEVVNTNVLFFFLLLLSYFLCASFLFVCLPVCLPACLPACLSACLPVCLPACLSVGRLSVGRSVSLPVGLTVLFASSRWWVRQAQT